jgi:hypothetical protein
LIHLFLSKNERKRPSSGSLLATKSLVRAQERKEREKEAEARGRESGS